MVLALVLVVAAIAVWQALEIANHLRRQARETSRVYGRFIAAFNDPRPDLEADALLALATEIRNSGLPLVVTDTAGQPTMATNLPGGTGLDDPRLLEYVREMDRTNPPIVIPDLGEVHFGALPVARRLGWLTALQLAMLLAAVAVGLWAYRSAAHRHRERVWVAMARESAHQMGTPLMSAEAWIDRLAEGAIEPHAALPNLRADIERLQRVAKRFERIGRPARRDRVGLGALAERIARYFEPRLPRHAHPVSISVEAPSGGPSIRADPVLLEWALEAMVRNSVDALSGRGGSIRITVEESADSATIRVADDGPGIAQTVRSDLFEPGVSTKKGGWGIGLALARRIVEDVHGGRLDVGPSPKGATFVLELPLTGSDVEENHD
ncbi:MAG: PAS domain-containing sensor histidine kinase [Gemmatimonadales bacterium]